MFRRWCNDVDGDSCLASYGVSLGVLCVVSVLMLWLGDHINAQNLAVTRYMARVQAPLAAHHYNSPHTEDITILLYDDEFLVDNGYAWPIPYGAHAEWLNLLADDPDSRPKAIFLDITFGQARNDPTLAEFVDTLCAIAGRGTPIFLAGLPDQQTGRLAIRPELMDATYATGEGRPQACVNLSGVSDAADPLDGVSWAYPLNWHRDARGLLQQGPAPAGAASGFRSTAAMLAADVGGIDLGEDTAPMALVWGASAPPRHPYGFWANCHPGEPFGKLLIPGVVRQLWEAPHEGVACPIHDTLSMSQLNQLEYEDFQHYLKDRYLMIGARVTGYDDYALSPVQGMIPGVFVHAMALDNLLTFKGEYKQQSSWAFPPPPSLLLAAVVAITAVFIVHAGFNRLYALLPQNHWLTPRPLGEGCTWGVRLRSLLMRTAAWLLRIWVQLVVALMMIVCFQSWFRIGMLPLIELIGMTLLAEGLGYLGAVRRFFQRDPECAEHSHTACPSWRGAACTASSPLTSVQEKA